MKFLDRAKVGQTRMTNDGYLAAQCRTARTGIQYYLGDEVGKPDKKVVTVYRPEESVFDRSSLGSYASKPVTDNHPDEMVTADNHSKYAKGFVGNEVARDGEFVSVPLMVTDASTIKKIKDGKAELSVGYLCDLNWVAGEAIVDGKTIKYDAIQQNIRANHVAIVDKARAGEKCRIGDASFWGTSPTDLTPNLTEDAKRSVADMSDKLRAVMFDGISIEVTDQGAQAIEKLTKQLSDSAVNVQTLKDSHKQAIADKDKELGTKDAEIEELKKNQLSDADLDQKVADRAEVVANAGLLVENFDAKGKSNEDIRKEVITAKFADQDFADKSADYIEARFDGLVSTLDKDAVKAAMSQAPNSAVVKLDDGDTAYNAQNEALENAWEGKQDA